MKKALLISLFATLIIFLGWNFYHLKSDKNIADKSKVEDENNIVEKEDGILLAQQQEFEYTKDISLGYIPKYRLIQATENLKAARLSGTYANRTSALTWTERGPNTDGVGPSNGNTRANNGVPSGRMRAIWVDLADATNKTVWVGGIDGGLWKTSDISASPATWTQPANGDFYSNLAIGSICQDPNSAGKDIMYFGTGEKTLNFDGVRGGGVWKSTDHGATWNLLPSTTGFWNVSKIVCDAAGNVYVATMGNGAGIQRSTNGGTTWTNITPTGLNTAVTDMKLSSTGRLHIACGYYNGYLSANPAGYRFTDIPATVTPATWTAPTTAFPNVAYNVELAVSGSTLYALPANSSYQTPTVYKSTNGGDTWAATVTSPPAASGTNDLSSGQAWYNIAIGVDPANPLNVVAGGLNCYRTIDGGTTWTQISRWVGLTPSYVHADQQTVVWNGSQVLVGTDGGIFYSADGGATFTDRNVGLRLKQFYSCAIHPTTTNYFLAGAQDNGSHQFANAGLSGTTEVTGGDGAFVHIDQNEPQYQFTSYTYSYYFRSTNGGASWSQVGFGYYGQFINPSDYDDINNNFYASDDPGYYQLWLNAPSLSTYNYNYVSNFGGGKVTSVKVSPYSPNRVFFGLNNGRIIKVDNAHLAAPTTTIITGSGMSSSTVSCVEIGTTENNLIATFSNYGAAHVWVSTTGGGSAGWTNITGNLPDIPVRWAMFYPEDNTKAILATEMGVYETTNINGSSTIWTQDPTFPVVRTDMLQYRPGDGTVAAATHGRGLWTSVIPFTIPYVRFAFDYNYQPEATAATSGCRNYKDYVINMKIDIAPAGDANLTLSSTGTATPGIDYDFTTNGNFTAPSNTLTFANGTTTPQPVTIRIYDDAEVEPTETFTLSYTIGGGTNAQAAPSSSSYTFTITDNDLAPAPATNAIATIAGSNRTEYIGSSGPFNFYTGPNIINSLSGASANLGCVTSTIFEGGNTWQSFYGGLRSQKVFDIAPSTNPGATYTVGLYLTTAELAGNPPAGLKIAKTTAATMAGATPGNTIVGTTTYVAYGSLGYVFTATFTGFSKFFLINNVYALPVNLLSFTGNLNNNSVLLNWSTSSEQNLKNFDIEKSTDGINFYKIGSVNAKGNNSTGKDYSFRDLHLSEANYYRLQMNDADGSKKFSQIVLIRYNVSKQNIWVVNNPFKDYIDLRFAKPGNKVKLQLVNVNGALVSEKVFTNPSAQIHWQLPNNLSSGIYILKAIADGEIFTTKLMKQ